MNQNTTIETIREAIGNIARGVSYLSNGQSVGTVNNYHQKAIAKLQDLANRLEAAPLKEQPPVEQSEPAAEHPLHAGYVILDGEKRELRVVDHPCQCPHCGLYERDSFGRVCKCNSLPIRIDEDGRVGVEMRLAPAAPPAVIEPEPPKCRTCEGVGLIIGFGACPEGCAKSRELYREKWEVIDAVREIISRKGDK